MTTCQYCTWNFRPAPKSCPSLIALAQSSWALESCETAQILRLFPPLYSLPRSCRCWYCRTQMSLYWFCWWFANYYMYSRCWSKWNGVLGGRLGAAGNLCSCMWRESFCSSWSCSVHLGLQAVLKISKGSQYSNMSFGLSKWSIELGTCCCQWDGCSQFLMKCGGSVLFKLTMALENGQTL
jgi:hypothetical protein